MRNSNAGQRAERVASGSEEKHPPSAAAAGDRERAAAGHAVQATGDAQVAARDAVAAEQSAQQAEAAAQRARDDADHAAHQATQAALSADELLLDEDAQKLAAQVSEEQPFGVPGRAISQRNLVRVGFTATFGGLLAVAAAATVVALQQELLILTTATFIAIGLEPAVAWLTRLGMRRGIAVFLISATSVGLVGLFLAAAVPPIVKEGRQLIGQGPQFLQQLQDKHTFIGHLNTQYHLKERLTAAASARLSLNSFGGLLSFGEAVVSFTFEVLIVLVLVLYLLADFPGIKRVVYRLVPLSRRPRVALLTDEILTRTGGYILGNLLTSLIAVACQYAILRALGVPYALVLSVFVGILDLVPLIGSTIAGALVTVVALASVSLTAAVINVVFTISYRLAEDYLINPRVLKRTVDVRPLVTVVAVLLGGALLGIIGALIAVPTAAAIQLIITEVIYPRMDTAGKPEPASHQRKTKPASD